MGVHANSLREATERLLNPSSEQGVETVQEQEVIEEETLDATDEDVSDEEVEQEEETSETDVGDSDEEDEPLEEDENTDGTFYTVKIDGEEFEVNLEELKKGYQLEKNYTKKSQALAEQTKALEAQKVKLEEERNKYIQVTQAILSEKTDAVAKAKQELGDIDRMKDPIGFVQKQLEVQDLEAKLKDTGSKAEAALAEHRQRSQEQMQQYLVQQRELLNKELSDLSTEDSRKEFAEALNTFAKGAGFSDEEIAGISSARDIIVLNKARLYDEMVANRAKVKEKKTPPKTKAVIRSKEKASENLKVARNIKEKQDKFKSSRKVNDAASLILERMQQRKPIRK